MVVYRSYCTLYRFVSKILHYVKKKVNFGGYIEKFEDFNLQIDSIGEQHLRNIKGCIVFYNNRYVTSII